MVGMMTACSSDDSYEMKSSNIPIKFTADVVGMKTRCENNSSAIPVQGSTFEDGTNINVYVSGTTSGTPIDGMGAEGFLTYTTSISDGTLSTTTDPKFPSTEHINVLAIYPSSVKTSQTSFTPEHYQCDYDSYKKSDLMCATLKDQAATGKKLNLNFKHLMAKVVVIINDASDLEVDSKYIFSCSLDNLYSTADISFSADGITLSNLSGKESTFIGTGNYSSYVNNSNGITGLIIPQKFTANNTLFSFIVSTAPYGATEERYIYTPTSDITFEAGHEYTFNLSIDKSTVKLNSYTVTQWTSETTKNDYFVQQ